MEDVLVIRKLLRVEIAEDPTRMAIRVVAAPPDLTAPVIPCVATGARSVTDVRPTTQLPFAPRCRQRMNQAKRLYY
jgi:hypothetical protein